jgi:hypothetical protein
MPPPFSAGLSVWSSEDGTPGSTTWQGSPNAALIAADGNFGSCLELVKTQATTKLRYMGQTPVIPGCYLRVTARVKAMSGSFPSVRIAGWAGGAGNVNVPGVVQVGPSVALTTYGEVKTVQAIIGTGTRIGVNMPWGIAALYGYFGLDLTGPNGGVVRIDDIEIEDITGAFHRKMMDWVDVRDYGALGNGTTDDAAAFLAADVAAFAAGQDLLVSAGTYYLNADVTIESRVRFEGTVTMPVNRRLSLTKNFDLPTYADAFGSEEAGFKKAFQALLNFTDHDALDLGGRRITVTAPIDMQAAVNNKTVYSIRRIIRNGQFEVVDGPAWATGTVTSQATYATGNPLALTSVANLANIEVGSLVTGVGVGREIYVTSKNQAAGTLTLSQPLFGAAGTQTYTFRRFRYVLDFSGFTQLDKFQLADVEVQCNGFASGILLPRDGVSFQLRDCQINRPKDRGITSHGTGCQGLQVDRCQFLSNEQSTPAQSRVSIALNVNANDVKLRDNRVVRFRHFAAMDGNGHLLVGNHIFQGDDEVSGVRLAGLIIGKSNVKTAITGNYIDNCFIEWTNEYEATPSFSSGFSFGGLTVTGNVFTSINVAPWFRFLVLKPYGTGHFIQGLNVTGNVFKAVGSIIDRVEGVDTSLATLDYSRMRNVWFEGNSYNQVAQITANPAFIEFDQATAQTTWTVAAGAQLPFAGWARNMESLVAEGMITGPAGERRSDMPYVQVEQGAAKQNVTLHWASTSKGSVRLRVRMDNPY